MSAPATETPYKADSGPADSLPEPPRQRRQSPPPQSSPPPQMRRKVRANNVNRAYYLCQVNAAGDLERFIVRFPTVGQARKGKQLTCRAAGLPETSVKIVRIAVVE